MPDEQTIASESANQEAKTKEGQRRVNLIWEFTQGAIAIAITCATIYCAIKKIESQILSNAFFLIVSMYFVRTNHQLIGGVGTKPLNQQR